MYEIKIVPAIEEDASMIADLSRDTFYETYAEENTPENMVKFMHYQFSKEQLMDEVGKKENHFFLAYINDAVVGYIKLKDATHKHFGDNNGVEISRFYARKAFIGKGVGKTLMETALNYAQKNGKEWIWLVVWKQNTRAIRFYESFGYCIFEECTFVLGDDIQHDWVMKRNVLLPE